MPDQPAAHRASAPSLAERLQQVTEALAAANTPTEVFAVVLQPALEALGAVAGAVLLLNPAGDRLELAATRGHGEGDQTLWQGGPLDAQPPAGDALHRREALFFEQGGELARAYPPLEGRGGVILPVASAVLPMFEGEQPLGALVLDFREPHHFTPGERRFLRTLAAQGALALGRARLLQRVRDETGQKAHILESISDAFYALDHDWHFTYVNREAERLWQRRREDLLGRVYGEVFPQVVDSAPYRAQQQVLRERRVVRLETVSPILGRWVDISIYPAEGGLAVYFKDISERKGQEQALLTLNAELEARVAERSREAEAARTRAEVLAALGSALQGATTPEEVAELALAQLGPAVGASCMNVALLDGEHIRTTLFWGEPPERLRASMTRPGLRLADIPNLQRVALGKAALTFDDYHATAGPVPDVPALSGAIEPILTPAGAVVGFLAAWRPPEPGTWDGSQRDLFRRAAATVGLALERAEQTKLLDEERAALDAFVAYKEAVGSESDVLALARQAVQVVRANLEHVSVAYYEAEDGAWKARVWSEDIPEDIVTQIQRGVPQEAPQYAEAARSRSAVFADGWSAAANGVQRAEAYGAAAFLPLVVQGETHSLFSVGVREARAWTEREKALVRAVVRGLTITLERTEITRRLREQNAQLDARTRALEGFAELTRDLALEGSANDLVRRAQELVLSLLPPGFAVYYENVGGVWRAQVQVGGAGLPALQQAIDDGFPVGRTPTLDWCAQTLAPHFIETYAPDTDIDPAVAGHLHAAACLPVIVNGMVVGVFNVPLFQEQRWSAADRAVLETVVRSLGSALERAEGLAELAEERRKLGAANEELEAFAYSVSHDLRTPVRHIVGFNDLLRASLKDRLEEKESRYLKIVQEASARMNTLIDAMLDLSRTARLPLRLGPVDLGALVAAVRAELEPDVAERQVVWSVAPLPLVMADQDTMRQVFVNLLSNALKYSRTREVARIGLWAEEGSQDWTVFVRDNGVGFDPQYAGRLFGVFQRLHRFEEFEGTGVGLANVRRIVGRHGGQVSAHSTPGEGATFSFTLPKLH